MNVPNWKAERYLLGELPTGEMATLKALENEGGKFSAMLKELRGNNAELLAKYPAKKLPKLAVIEKVPSHYRLYVAACAAMLLCTTSFLIVLSGEDMMNGAAQSNIAMNEDGTRVKGLKTNLEIWRKISDSTEKLANNSEVKAGDLLQMRYIVEEKCYGVILSMDGNGVLTIHLAGKGGRAAELEAGKIISLGNAYELDNAPKHETFYLITASNEFELAPVAENILKGKLPKNLQIAQVTLKKK